MTTFVYKARDKQGLPIAGTVDAENRQIPVQNLRSLGYSVVSIKKKSQIKIFLQDLLSRRRKKTEQLIFFTQQLQVMLKSGIPLIEALSGLVEQTKDKLFKQTLLSISQDIKGGMNFSASLAKYPVIFSETFVSMIEMGETGGVLEKSLDRLTQSNSQELETRACIKSAFTYPIILVVVAIIILGFLLINILPKFVLVFETYGAKLPLPTRILLTMSSLMSRFWHIGGLIILLSVFYFKRFIKSEKGEHYFHFYLLKMPLFGELYTKTIISKFTQTFGAMTEAGVPILKALSVSERTVPNVVIKKVIHNICLSVGKGENLAKPFKVSGFFPPMVIQMISAGEKTGQLDKMLLSIANFYEQEVGHTIKNITTILEPVLLLTMGSAVAFIAFSVLLPIFNLVKVFR